MGGVGHHPQQQQQPQQPQRRPIAHLRPVQSGLVFLPGDDPRHPATAATAAGAGPLAEDGKREQARQRLQRYGMEAAVNYAGDATAYGGHPAGPHCLPPPSYADAQAMKGVGPEDLKELHDVYRERQLNSYRQQQLRRQIMESQPPPGYVDPPLAALGDSSHHSAESGSDAGGGDGDGAGHDGRRRASTGGSGSGSDDAKEDPPSYAEPPHYDQASRLSPMGAH
jgi:hypothetical protein